MGFQSEPGIIRWKLHLSSPPDKVFDALATDSGRARFWAESAHETNGVVTFEILNYDPFSGRVLRCEKPFVYSLEYASTNVEFTLKDDATGGTELLLVATDVDESLRMEMVAGWVSVLMAMKAAVDHGVDLRNHNKSRSWRDGYADN